jgi:hypothetical protein
MLIVDFAHYSTTPLKAGDPVLQSHRRQADARRVKERSMPVDRSYIADNAAALHRLRTLVGRLSDADLARPTPGGWTVASSLAHVAFWDQRVLFWLDRWEHGEPPRGLDQAEVDWINDAGKPLCLALPPRVAARLTVEIAEQVDRRLAALPDDRIASNAAAGEPLLLTRAHHRKTHLDEIERVLA